jgi:hypothetical protein
MNDQQNIDNMIYYHTWVSTRAQREQLEEIKVYELTLLMDAMKIAPPTKDDDRDLVSAFQKLSIGNTTTTKK